MAPSSIARSSGVLFSTSVAVGLAPLHQIERRVRMRKTCPLNTSKEESIPGIEHILIPYVAIGSICNPYTRMSLQLRYCKAPEPFLQTSKSSLNAKTSNKRVVRTITKSRNKWI